MREEVEIAEKCSPRAFGGKNGFARTMIYTFEDFVLFSLGEKRDEKNRARARDSPPIIRLSAQREKKNIFTCTYNSATYHVHIIKIRFMDNTEHPAFKFNQ